MRFGDKVRELRTANGLSQRALGEQVGPGAVHNPVVRVDAEAATGQDRPRFLGHGQDVKGRRVGEAVGHREDLERPAEGQHFHVLEDQGGEVAGGRHGVSSCLQG